MSSEFSQLLDELREICSQYAKEVPTKRRAWPESVKSRVLRLRFLGVSNHRIAQETGIPVMTLYTWKMPTAEEARRLPAPAESDSAPHGFVPVRVVKRKTGLPVTGKGRAREKASRLLTVRNSDRRTSPPTVTVVHPSGLRLEGLSFEQAMEAARTLLR